MRDVGPEWGVVPSPPGRHCEITPSPTAQTPNVTPQPTVTPLSKYPASSDYALRTLRKRKPPVTPNMINLASNEELAVLDSSGSSPLATTGSFTQTLTPIGIPTNSLQKQIITQSQDDKAKAKRAQEKAARKAHREQKPGVSELKLKRSKNDKGKAKKIKT